MKKLFTLFLLFSLSLYAQEEETKPILNIGAAFGTSAEMGPVQSDGFNPVYGVNISRHLTSQVALSAGFMSGSMESGDVDVNFQGFSIDVLHHILQLKKAAMYVKAGFGFLGYDGSKTIGGELQLDGNISSFEEETYEQAMFEEGSCMIPAGFGFKYQLFNKLHALLDYSLVFPSKNGLDGVKEFPKTDAFSKLSLGLSFSIGGTTTDHAEWANPIDVFATQVKMVEQDIVNLTIDTDGDGVADKFDKENNTPQGVSVDGSGKALDVDSDGIPDYQDVDPFTAPGVSVDSNGVEIDDDQDGVPNSLDEEPNSPAGSTVNFQGRQIVGKGAFLPTVYFDLASSDVSYSNYQRLATVASVLKANPSYKLRVIGFADSVGSTDNNYKLGLKRANAVIESLVNTFSIDINRMIADSQGENNLLANESEKMKLQTTSDGLSQTRSFKSLNRRVEFIIE